jgi:hypothetical protein
VCNEFKSVINRAFPRHIHNTRNSMHGIKTLTTTTCMFVNLTYMEPCIVNVFLSTTEEMQRYTMFFIVVCALHVSSGFSAYHQELKNCTCSIGTCQTCVLLSLAWLSRSAHHQELIKLYMQPWVLSCFPTADTVL